MAPNYCRATRARISCLEEAAIRSNAPHSAPGRERVRHRSWPPAEHEERAMPFRPSNNCGAFWYRFPAGPTIADNFIECLRLFLASQRSKVIVTIAADPVHKAKKLHQSLQPRADHINIDLLPGYAPNLNTDAVIWHHIRHKSTSNKSLDKGESLTLHATDLKSRKQEKLPIQLLFCASTVRYGAA